MDHFHEDVYGFSQIDLFALYKKMVERFSSGSHFVEIGTFLGYLGFFTYVVLNALTKAPLKPKNHPMLIESKHHHI